MTQRIFRRTLAGAICACLAGAVAGCAAVKNPSAPDSAAIDASTAASMCVTQVNALRASIGEPPLTQSKQIDDFSAEAAQIDGLAHQEQKAFVETNGGNGLAMAENVIPWWKVSDWGSVENVVFHGIRQMWVEGPGSSHYANMTGRYTHMGCGVAVINGEVTVSQNFR